MKEAKDRLPLALDVPGAARFRRMDWGETAVTFVQLEAGADASPLLQGLPGDLCACPHWGYMLEGAIQVQYADGRVETCRAGEVFYWPPGHTVRSEQGCGFVEFSPKDQLTPVYDHLKSKL